MNFRPCHLLCCLAAMAFLFINSVSDAAEPSVGFKVQLDTVHKELSPDYCWFHPRVTAIPGAGQDGQPSILLTLQKHLRVSDHYSGLYYMISDDGGKTWTKPVLPPELDWQKESEDVTIAVCDVTPGWHPHTQKAVAIGVKLRYGKNGEHLYDKPRSHECAYAIFDPKTKVWSNWKFVETPLTDEQFYLLVPGCVQWIVRPDGTLLIPVYTKGSTGEIYSTTIMHCSFDGETMKYLGNGDTIALNDGRGVYEPSMVFYNGLYYLTLRNDSRGYVTTSQDGLHFEPIKAWTFDDGQPLGSYNTQQHWLTHSDGLFLSYTRTGYNNDHIPRHRAPIFLAQVNPETLQVIRETEQVVIPEKGVMLGNFGATAISPDESWVTDAEYILSATPDPKGADGSVFASRVIWSKPNLLARTTSALRIVTLGDSITEGVRKEVEENQTFASLLGEKLKAANYNVEVINVGKGGERTEQAVKRLVRDVISQEPTIVTIMYGTNDSYVDKGEKDSRLSKDKYREYLTQIVKRLQQAGIRPVLMTEPRWGDKAVNGIGENPNVRLEAYLDSCRQVAKELDVPLVEHYAKWSKAREEGKDIGAWTTDQCHPNVEGHAIMAETIYPVVEKELAKILNREVAK
ncbi:MAG: GDSL-type esterase/lipase family protein [Planctomycetaceae bacterium]